MINNVQVWSHADTEYMVSTKAKSKSAAKIMYQRVTVAGVFNGEKTLIGVSVQHPSDTDVKTIGQEAAVKNALIHPVMVINKAMPLQEYQFNRIARAVYSMYDNGLEATTIEWVDASEVYLTD